MAVVHASRSQFALHHDGPRFVPDWLVTGRPTVVLAEPTHVREVLGGPPAPVPVIVDFYGSGFRYDDSAPGATAYPATGVVTQMTLLYNGVDMAVVTGLSASWAQLGDADGNLEFNAILLAGDDRIWLTPRDDMFAGFGGDDTMEGAGGVDTAVYLGGRGGYAFVREAGHDHVFGSEGTDTLTGFERIRFADGGIALDLAEGDSTAQALAAIATVAWSRMWDPATVGWALELFDLGMTTEEVFRQAIHQGHIDDLGGTSDIALVRLVVRNIYGVTLSTSEASALAAQYLETSGGSMSRAQALAYAAQLDANVAHANLVGWAETGVPYA